MSAEEWRPIEGFPGYEVSSLGRVKSLRRREPHILRPCTNRGYRLVSLAGPRGARTKKVHQLVADAFDRPRPSLKHEVRHLNGIRGDDRAENLRWGTRSENMQDALVHGTHHNAAKVECSQGHPYDEENTYVLPSRPTQRYCRTCHRLNAIERREFSGGAAA